MNSRRPEAEPAPPPRGAARANPFRACRLHLAVYGAVCAVLLAVDVLATAAWWFFWPVFIWGFAVFLHYIVVKSLNVDDGWAARRAGELADKAYDLGHIDDLHDRYGGARKGWLRRVGSRRRAPRRKSD